MTTISKTILSLITILSILITTFICLHIAPGGPFDSERKLPPEIIANLQSKYGLSPQGDLTFSKWMIQEFNNYGHILISGSLGPSLKHKNTDVSTIIAKAIIPSLILGSLALFVSILIGIPMGLYLTYQRNTWFYPYIESLTRLLIIVPHFIWAALLVWLFSYQLNWLPPALWESPLFFILPAFILALNPLGSMAQLIHQTSLTQVNAEYIKVAAAKGVSPFSIYTKHILKNSLIPLCSLMGPLAAHLLTGSFIIENIFSIPGMGRHFVMGILDRDYFLVMGVILVFSILLVILNLLSELAAQLLNPRGRHE